MSKKGRKLGKASLLIFRILFEGNGKVDYMYKEFRRYGTGPVYRGFYKRLYNLEQAGYIKKTRRKTRNQSFFHLTPKGRLAFLKYLHLEKLQKTKWDGHWRVIIFDIPETLKKWREFLRPHLKDLGFLPLQESVYITPYPVTQDLDNFLEKWNLRKYFRYLTVIEIDDAGEFKEKFGLK